MATFICILLVVNRPLEVFYSIHYTILRLLLWGWLWISIRGMCSVGWCVLDEDMWWRWWVVSELNCGGVYEYSNEAQLVVEVVAEDSDRRITVASLVARIWSIVRLGWGRLFDDDHVKWWWRSAAAAAAPNKSPKQLIYNALYVCSFLRNCAHPMEEHWTN